MANKKRPQQPGQRRSGNPSARNATRPATGRSSAPPATGWRATLNRISVPAVMWMHSLPRWVVPSLMGLLLILGLFLEGPQAWLGALLLLVVALFVGWLLALSWPVLSPGGRAARALVTAGLFGLVYLKATGQL